MKAAGITETVLADELKNHLFYLCYSFLEILQVEGDRQADSVRLELGVES